MPQLIKPTAKVLLVPREGELEITVNINITVDGKVSASVENATILSEEREIEEKAPHIIPDFSSGLKLNFGKKEG
jgi:hypothetical protein